MSAPGNVRRVAESRGDWETPWDLFRELDREFRFSLDAAASQQNRKCRRYLTEEEDSLTADMIDETIWLNPPYGAGLKNWVAACAAWSLSGNTVVALLPAATDTEWFEVAFAWADEVRFLRGRVQFVGTTSSNPSGSVIFVFRQHPVRIDLSANVPLGLRVERFDPPRVILWDWKRDVEAAKRGAAQ